MNDSSIKPEKITKPIQLLGAWLLGLLLIDACFLRAASTLPTDSWMPMALVIAAIVNVPLFLLAVFLLQTKYRPELQEDSFYSTYLSHRTNQVFTISKEQSIVAELNQRISTLEIRALTAIPRSDTPDDDKLNNISIGVNKHLSDKDKIGSKLLEHGIIGFTSFGSDGPPDSRVVAISKYLPNDVVKHVVALSRELGFEHFSIFDNRLEDTIELVLFGAYGAPDYEIGKGTTEQSIAIGAKARIKPEP